VDVTPVNDAPQGTDTTVTTREDTAYPFTPADFGFTDPNDSSANSLLAVRITTLPGAGSLTDNGGNVTAGQFVSLADIAAGRFVFTPAADANGTDYAAFTFQVQDDGGTANGGTDLDPTPNTITIDVTPVNDAPAFDWTQRVQVTLDTTVLAVVDGQLAWDLIDDDFSANNSVVISDFTTDGTLGPVFPVGGVTGTLPDRVTLADLDFFNEYLQAVTLGDAIAFSLHLTSNFAGGVPDDLAFFILDPNGFPLVTTDLLGDALLTIDLDTVVTVAGATNPAVPTQLTGPAGPDQSVLEDAGPQAVAAIAARSTAGPLDEAAQALAYQVSTDNPALFAAAPALAPNGDLTYTPAPDATGSATVTVVLRDDGGTADGGVDTSAPQSFTITVTPINDAPQGTDTTVTTLEDSAYTFLAADFGFTDPSDGSANALLAVKIATLPGAGSLTDSGVTVTAGQFVSLADISTGKLVFTPAANANGPAYAAFSFQVQDDGGVANSGVDLDPTPNTITIDVTPVNDAPAFDLTQHVGVTLDTSVLAGGDGQLAWDLTDGDFAVNNTVVLTAFTTEGTLGAATTLGGVEGTLPGRVTMADADFFNELLQSLTFGTSLTFSLHLTSNFVGGVPDNLAFFLLDPNGSPLVATDLLVDALLTIDLDVVVTVAGATNPAVPTQVTGPAGPDQTVLEDAAPQVVAAFAAGIRPGPADEGAQALAYQVSTDNPALFAIEPALAPDGTLTYTPAPDANGQALVSVVLLDDGGTADGGVNTSPAQTFTLTVIPLNDVAVAQADAFSTPEDTPLTVSAPGLLGNDSDVDGDLLTGRLVSGPAHGALTLNPDGSFTYTPNLDFHGADSFTYRGSDGALDSNEATVALTITPVNDAPVAAPDTAGMPEDTPLTIQAATLLANDSDVDGGLLTLIGVGNAVHGSVVLDGDGDPVFTPAPNFNGAASFEYTVSDGQGGSDTATVTITVTPVNDAPVATDDAFNTPEDTPLSVLIPGLLGNDTDVDGDALTALLVSGPAHGSVTLNPDGSFAYTPAPKFLGADAFTYQVTDGALPSAPVTVALTVNPVVVSVDSLVRVSYSGYMFNRSTNTFDTVATITNISTDGRLISPMSLVITSIIPSSVTLANPTGQTSDGKPFIAVPLSEAGLAPGESITGILLKFNNPLRTRFAFTSSVLAVDPLAEAAAPADLLASAEPASRGDALGWFPASEATEPSRLPDGFDRMDQQGSHRDLIEAGLLGRGHASGVVPPLVDWLGSSTSAELTGGRGAAPTLFRPASPWVRPFLLELAEPEDGLGPNSQIRLVIPTVAELEPLLGPRR
jgi:VCBS repeat-containing protein